MITQYVWDQAKKIIDNDEIHLVEGSTITNWHFVVKNNGKATDVFYYLDKKTNKYIYSCTAIAKDKVWSCSMFTGDQSKPFCSHTLAARLFIKKLRTERY